MKRGYVLILAGGLVLSGAVRAAQDPRRPMTPPPPMRPANTMQPNQCMQERGILGHQEMQLDNSRAEMAGIDAEMNTMRRRMDDLNRRRNELMPQIQNNEKQVNWARNNYQQRCAAGETCSDYETRIAQLQMEGRPIQDQMNVLRNDINMADQDRGNVSQQSDALRNEYQQRHCGNLVPGQCSQEDIDRCSQIFSEWNRIAMLNNQSNSRLPTLRARYDQLSMQQQSLDRRAQDLRNNMNRMCSNNPHINELNQYAQALRDAEALHQILDRVAADAARMQQTRLQ